MNKILLKDVSKDLGVSLSYAEVIENKAQTKIKKLLTLSEEFDPNLLADEFIEAYLQDSKVRYAQGIADSIFGENVMIISHDSTKSLKEIVTDIFSEAAKLKLI